MPVRRAQPLVFVDVDRALASATRVLGENVRSLRGASGLSQERLAEMARLSTIYLGQVERGTASNPSLGVVAALAEALGVPPGVLLSVGPQPPSAAPRSPRARKPRPPVR
jgi:transcriptional regulator with XRE-family HTH domain